MRQETVTLQAPRDFELDRDRPQPLAYTITWPDRLPAPGLVLVIGGCGGEGETSGGKSRNTREHVVATSGMAAVTVDFHCIQTRPWNGATVHIEERDHYALIGMAYLAGLASPEVRDVEPLTRTLTQAGIKAWAYAKIKPGKGEDQNFGVLQAMDHLAVLGHLIEQGAPFDRTQIFALGSSHGGYIAHLLAKIAPGVLAGIIDNSAYVQPPMSYLGIGDILEYPGFSNGVELRCRVESAWSVNDRREKNFYDRNRDLIRDTIYLPHLEIMAQAAEGSRLGVTMVHCADDDLVDLRLKQRQAFLLSSLGMPTHLQVVRPEDIDGVLFKAYVHSLSLSLKRLFSRDITWLLKADARGTGKWGGTVEYPCVDTDYRFTLVPQAPYVQGEVVERFPVGGF